MKTLERAFPGKGRALRTLLQSAEAVRSHPAAQARIAECYHPPTLADMRLHALDAEAGTYGREVIWGPDAGPLDGPEFEYLNTGDMYTATIIRRRNGRYFVADIGSIIEREGF